ncbi:hypothetical protein NRIC0767_14590 [Lactobacillus delbrueckii subsp. allosunkii]|nr:hypothetical protein NRIC0767_14590 [Lactobacillus delbrueckii subsp. sunkii]
MLPLFFSLASRPNPQKLPNESPALYRALPANGLPKLTTCLCSKTIFTAFTLAGSQQSRFSVEDS